jgi:hypothetical protein
MYEHNGKLTTSSCSDGSNSCAVSNLNVDPFPYVYSLLNVMLSYSEKWQVLKLAVSAHIHVTQQSTQVANAQLNRNKETSVAK